MGLTGLQIFKLLPNTNCRKCGSPTCLAFAMRLAAGKESLEKCPDASPEAKAALGAASAPPIRAVTIGRGPRAITVGEETVFFRHEKTFAHKPGLFRVIVPGSRGLKPGTYEEIAAVRIERAGEVFQVDGVAIVETAGRAADCATAAAAATKVGLPVAVLAATAEGAATIVQAIKDERPLLVPPHGVDLAPYVSLAARFAVALVVSAPAVEKLAAAAAEAARAGVQDILLEPAADDAASLHRDLSIIRRAALERVHPGLAYPVFLRTRTATPAEAGSHERGDREVAFARAVVGITKFASILAVDDASGETWTPLWTLRQNICTDPQKPLQMDAGVYPIGEPDASSPLLVTTNFSLTYFIVSTELEATGMASHLAVVDAEGMSVLTAWSAGKFSGDRVAKALKEMGITERVQHKTAIIPGYVAVISGELEDGLGAGWRVLTGPQEASDIAPFLRDVWSRV